MWQHIVDAFTKPELERSFVDNLILAICIVVILAVIVGIIFLIALIIDKIKRDVSHKKRMSCKNCRYSGFNSYRCTHDKCIGCKDYEKENKNDNKGQG